MKHKVLIWSKSKETGRHLIESHMELSEDDREAWAMEKYANDHCLDDDREYHASLDETMH